MAESNELLAVNLLQKQPAIDRPRGIAQPRIVLHKEG
jgi:hypothetical protein